MAFEKRTLIKFKLFSNHFLILFHNLRTTFWAGFDRIKAKGVGIKSSIRPERRADG